MNRMALRLGIACAALAGLVACGGNDAPPVISFPDSGPAVDSGTDAGPPDSGPPAACEVDASSDFPPLPSACLPRCTNATASAVNACADTACLQAALEADTTPSVPFIVNGMDQPGGLDCDGCFGYQQLSCAFDVCPAETAALLMCMSGCDAQNAALNTCIQANSTAFQSCFSSLGPMCFGATSSFLPDFSPRPAQLQPLEWDAISPATRAAFAGAHLAH
jgi:hypothetical protein